MTPDAATRLSRAVGGEDPSKLLLQVRAEKARRNLDEFLRQGWHVLHDDEDNELVWGWHLDALCEHLEAVETGDIQKLIVNIPPGMTKSMTASVYFPAWVWTRNPGRQFLCASYSGDLSTRDAVRCRRVIRSDWYQRRWGDTFGWSSDQVTKTRFENDENGFRVATSVGKGTGERADFLILDDPHNAEEVESPAERKAALRWLRNTWSTRHNQENSRDILIMQRLHEEDATSELLDQWGDEAEHLMLPMEYEPDRSCVTVLGDIDPRETKGELLLPERKSRKAVEREQRRLGSYGTAAQHQQRPTSREGGLFNDSWFLPPIAISEVPADCLWCRYWDKAASEGEGAYTVGLLMGMSVSRETAFVADVARDRLAPGPREDLIDEIAEEDRRRLGRHGFTILVEQEGGAGGKESALNTRRRLEKRGYTVELDNPASKGNKFVRADPLSGAARKGYVKVLEGEWVEDFTQEMNKAGPGARYLDQMDAASGAYNWLSAQARVFQEAADAAPEDREEVRPAEGTRDPDTLFGGVPGEEVGGSWL